MVDPNLKVSELTDEQIVELLSTAIVSIDEAAVIWELHPTYARRKISDNATESDYFMVLGKPQLKRSFVDKFNEQRTAELEKRAEEKAIREQRIADAASALELRKSMPKESKKSAKGTVDAVKANKPKTAAQLLREKNAKNKAPVIEQEFDNDPSM